MPHLFFLLLLVTVLIMSAYRWRRGRATSRPGVRYITGFGAAFCVMSFSLWVVTRMDDITATLPSPHNTGIFSTPWPWVSALCLGVALLAISFFTRVSRAPAA
jgi:O-antigen/teichoic acid export membrane protein